jgi:hypothetical protein
LVYVGGIDEKVNEELLHAAFIPFGDIKSVQIARDYATSTHSSSFHFTQLTILITFALNS